MRDIDFFFKNKKKKGVNMVVIDIRIFKDEYRKKSRMQEIVRTI